MNKKTSLSLFLAGAVSVGALALVVPAARSQDAEGMQDMMSKMKKYAAVGEHHAALERFLGEWNTETRFFMGGGASPAEKGTCSGSWLMEGRFLKLSGKGSMMGMPVESFTLLGYDNFKQSYVTTFASSIETAMRHAEGDMTRDGKALIVYGTLDEYLTGEHDKMVKYVYRFPSADEIVLEVHDLPIGEEHTKVVEIRFRRSE